MKRPLDLLARVSASLVVFAALGLTQACSTSKPGDKSHPSPTSSTSKTTGTMLDGEVSNALKAFPDAKVLASRRGVPTFVRASFGVVSRKVTTNDEVLRKTLVKLAPVFKLTADSLVLAGVKPDITGGSHAHYNQKKNGLPVVGGELVLHLDARGKVYAASGTARDGETLTATAKVDAAFAESVATNAVSAVSGQSTPARLVYRQPADGAMRLAWEVDVMATDNLTVHELVYVDALDGVLVERISQNSDALVRSVHTVDNQVVTKVSQIPGKLLRSEGGPASADDIANENYERLGQVHGCLKKLFDRDSYDGKGGKLVSAVHALFASGEIVTPNNAQWLGAPYNQMLYGDGDEDRFTNLAKSFDVSAHEIGHGVTKSEANLEYANESGALNESMSDTFAALCDYDQTKSLPAAWKMGESVFTPEKDGDALRYMDDPTKDGQSFDYYPERYTGTGDHGGVHLNSGIANLAFVLVSQGGQHPRGKTNIAVKGIGIDKAGMVFYRALTTYMTATTDFMGARAATAQAAKDLFGATAEASVQSAWDAVGVPRPAGEEPAPDMPAPDQDPQPQDPKDPQPDPQDPPAPGDEPAEENPFGCCVDDQCYSCPSQDAMNRCMGTDLFGCLSNCTSMMCVIGCVDQAENADHDPSECTAN